MSDSAETMLRVAEMLSARLTSDKAVMDLLAEFKGLVSEQNTGLADAVDKMEKLLDRPAQTAPAFDTEALAKAIAVTLVAGLRNMPAPVVKFEAPAGRTPTDWSRIEIDLHRDAAGRIGDKLTLTRK
jgi:hypothetical protein